MAPVETGHVRILYGKITSDIETFSTEYEITAEIFLPYYGILGKLLRCALEKDLPLEKKIGAVGD